MNPRSLLVVGVLVCVGCSRNSDAPAVEVAQSRPGIDPAVFKAWKAHGFEAGWIGEMTSMNRPVPFIFISEFNDQGLEELTDVVPAFRIAPTRTAPKLRELPPIEKPFGLVVSGTVPIDVVLKEVGGLKNLSVLLVETTNASDEGVMALATLDSLSVLRLGPSRATIVGFKHLAKLKSLRHLNLFHNAVTDEGLEVLSALNLTTLDLSGTDVTDDGLRHLSAHTNLKCLSLTRTSTVTDAGVPHLARLKNLTDLDISRTEITDAGAEKLREQLPKCRVFLKN
jgi:hypothetical protein